MLSAADETCIDCVARSARKKDGAAHLHQRLTTLLTSALLCSSAGCAHRVGVGEVLTYAGAGTTLAGAGLLTESYAHGGHGDPGPAVSWTVAGVGVVLAVIGIAITDKQESVRMTTAARSRAESSVVIHCAAAMPPSPCQQPPGPAP
jgi:hypothetical protein